jgi:crossover junction endodeoxyribonuclease RuvC
MVKVLLGLPAVPAPHDAADALAVAICHVHSHTLERVRAGLQPARQAATSWRRYRPSR